MKILYTSLTDDNKPAPASVAYSMFSKKESFMKKILLSMKIVALTSIVVLMLGSFTNVSGASVGDYRSNTASMNWGTATSWQVCTVAGTPGTWATASSYPGQNTGTGNVLIQNGHTVAIDVSPANAIASLTVGGGTSGILEYGNNITTNTGGSRTLSVTGAVIVSSGASFIIFNRTGVNAHTLNIGGNLTVDGSFNMTSTTDDNATVVFNGSSQQTISGTGATCTFYSLTASNTSSTGLVLGRNISLAVSGSQTATTLTITAGDIFDLANYTCNRATSGAGTLTVAGTMMLGGNTGGQTGSNYPSGFSTNTLTSGTVIYDYAGSQTVYNTPTYNNLIISGSGTKTPGGNLTITGNLSVSGGAFDLANYTANRSTSGGTLTVASGATLKIGGTNTLPSNYSTHSIGCTSTIEYAGTSQTVANLNSSQTYGNLVLSGSVSSSPKTLQTGTTNICNDLILSGNATTTTVVGLTIGRNLTIGDGTSFTAAGFTLTVNGLTTIGNGTSGSLIFSSALNPSKTFVGLVTVNKNASWTENDVITPEFRGGFTATPSISVNTGVHTFTTNDQALSGTFVIPNVTVTGVTLTNNNTLTVSAALLGTGGLTQAVNSTLNIGGTSGITTLTATANSNTVNYTASSAGQTIKSTSYYNLTLSNASGTQTAGGNITANTLNNTNAASTLDMAAYSLSLTSVNNTGTIKTQNTSSTPISSGITWGGIVEYNASGAQTVVSGTYTNLALSGSGAKTLPTSALSVTGNLALNGTATATTQANLSVGGKMDIASGALLTVSPANQLTVTGLTKLLGPECLVLESSSSETAPASFLDGGYDALSSGTAKVNRYFDNSGTALGISWDWHLLSSPVAAQTIWTAFIPAPNWTPNPGTDPWDFYYYNPNTPYTTGHTPWVNIKNSDGTYNSATFDLEGDGAGFGPTTPPLMNIGRGYLVAFDNAGIKSFSGALNTGNKDVTVKNTADLYNLVGNPYPSSIDWMSSSLVRGNLEDVGSSVYAYWIYNEDYGNYGTCLSNVASGTNGTTQYIAPGQGFFVKAKDLTPSLGSPRVLLGLKQSARAHSTQHWLKDASSADNYISLKLTTAANALADEIIVAFDENYLGTSGAEKFASWYSYAPEIFTVKEGKSYSIDLYQGVTSNLTVNVSVKCGVNSTYTLTATDIGDFALSNIVYLEDLQTGNKVNLKEVGSYSFTGGPNDDKTRFRITFAEITGTNEPETLKPVYIYSFGKDVYVNANSLTIGNFNVYIYDAVGRMVYRGSYVPAAGKQKFTTLSVPGAYVVKVISRTGIVTTKIIIP